MFLVRGCAGSLKDISHESERYVEHERLLPKAIGPEYSTFNLVIS
jgi:hypothetical protein